MALTTHQKFAAYGISFSLALLDDLKKKEKSKGARYSRIARTEEALNKCLDMFQLEAFDQDDLKAAGALFDLMEKEVKKVFKPGPVKRTRDTSGKFVRGE